MSEILPWKQKSMRKGEWALLRNVIALKKKRCDYLIHSRWSASWWFEARSWLYTFFFSEDRFFWKKWRLLLYERQKRHEMRPTFGCLQVTIIYLFIFYIKRKN